MAYASPITLPRHYFEGEDKRLPFIIYASGSTAAAIAAGTAARQDLSDAELSWMLKRRRTDTDEDAVVPAKTIGDGITLTAAADGEGYVDLTAEDIAAIAGEKQHYHELKRTNAPRTVLTFGVFVLNQAVHDGPAPPT